MSDFKRITVRSKPLMVADKEDSQCTKVVDVAIATKHGMNVRVRSDEMVIPDADVFFYVKLEHPWRRNNGAEDYDEIITDGDDYWIAFRSLGDQRLEFNQGVVWIITKAIEKFVLELTS